jgi:hypothetical protein
MKLFIQFSFLFLIGTVNAQSVILLEQDTAIQIHENVDLSDIYEAFFVDLLYRNNTDEAISVLWSREIGENCPEEWDVISADMNITYPPFVNEAAIPMPLEPGGPNTFLRKEFYPRSVPGCCDVRVVFFLEQAQDNPIDTGYFHIEVNDDGCMTTSVSDKAISPLHFYPNPTSDVLNIEGGLAIESIEISDVAGRIYDVPFVAHSRQIDLSALRPGMYIFRARSHTGELRVGKVLKQ